VVVSPPSLVDDSPVPASSEHDAIAMHPTTIARMVLYGPGRTRRIAQA
jgi:hypothetical protein